LTNRTLTTEECYSTIIALILSKTILMSKNSTFVEMIATTCTSIT